MRLLGVTEVDNVSTAKRYGDNYGVTTQRGRSEQRQRERGTRSVLQEMMLPRV